MTRLHQIVPVLTAILASIFGSVRTCKALDVSLDEALIVADSLNAVVLQIQLDNAPAALPVPLGVTDMHRPVPTPFLPDFRPEVKPKGPLSLYALPYSMTLSQPNWKRLWINTGVLTTAFVGTLMVLECLPEDATSWNRAELQSVPLGTRWVNHVIKEGPEWDHDKFVFNYLLHPYAGAAYFMGARSAGFNFYQSLLYATIISTVGWEFGVEAFMERPSIQDLFITPLVGSAIGEGFYHIKRYLVDHDYHLLGSPVIGNIVAFIVDPLNEVVGLFGGNEARRVAHQKKISLQSSWSMLSVGPHSSAPGLTVTLTF